jgi:hypothetical protein
MNDFILEPKEPKPVKQAKKLLPALLKKDSKLVDEIEQLVARAQAEERILVEKELGLQPGMSGYGDSHYNIYKGMQLSGVPKVQESYLNGTTTLELKEKIKDISLNDLNELKALYESIQGADISQPDATLNNQNGLVLKKRQSESELRLIQLIVNSRYNADPYVRNIFDNLTRYIVGKGIQVTVPDDDVQVVLDDFSRDFNVQEIFKDFIKTSLKDGEGGICLESSITKGQNPEVDWDLYKVFSEEIRGFEYKNVNPGKKFTYFKQAIYISDQSVMNDRTWIPDIEYWYQFNTRGNLNKLNGKKSEKPDITENKVLVWHQMGDKRELRGRCILEPVLRDCRLLEDFRINRAIMNYERSKVLYVRSQKTVGINRRGQSTEIKKSPSPKGGTQLTIGPGETYTMQTASLQAQDADYDGLLFLYSISAGTNMPVYLLGMRSDQINYSAIKNTDSPFHQMILDYSDDFALTFKKIFRWVIYRNIKAGILEKTVTVQTIAKEKQEQWQMAITKGIKILIEAEKKSKEVTDPTTTTNSNLPNAATVASIQKMLDDSMIETVINTIDIPIEIMMADAVKPDPLELAKTAFIERKLGIVSSQTLSEQRGHIWSKELIRQLNEMMLGIWPPQTGAGNQDSSNANSGLGDGNNVNSGDGATNQNTK